MPLLSLAVAKCDKCGREKPVQYPYPSCGWDELLATDGTSLTGWRFDYTDRGWLAKQVRALCGDCLDDPK